jgi:S1-C subfamily serine protease
MKKTTLIIAVAMIAGPWSVAAEDPLVTTGEEGLIHAHEQLQDAVEVIRSYHLQRKAGEPGALRTASRAELLFEIDRPRMGVVVESIRGGEADGARVLAVTPGGPAEEAGIEAGDVITHVDGVALVDGPGSPHEVLVRKLGGLEAGDTVQVELSSDGEPRSVTVTLRKLEGNHLVFPDAHAWLDEGDLLRGHFDPSFDWHFPHGWMSMELVSLNEELGEYFGTDEGVLVVRAPESPELGLRGGDVIISIDDRIVRSPTHTMRILRSYEPDEQMAIEIMRNGGREVITATVPERRVRILERWDGG